MVDVQPWIVDYILSNPQWPSTSRLVEVGKRLKEIECHDVPATENSAAVRLIHDNGYGIVAVFKEQPQQQNSNDTYLDSLDDEDPKMKLTRGALLVIHDYSVHFVFNNPGRYYFYMQVDKYNVLDQRVGFIHSKNISNCMNHPVVLYFAQHLARRAESTDSETAQHKTSSLSQLVDCLSEPNAAVATSIGLGDADKSVLNARTTRSRSRGQSGPSVPETTTDAPQRLCCHWLGMSGAAPVTDFRPFNAVSGAEDEVDDDAMWSDAMWGDAMWGDAMWGARKAEDLIINRQDKKHLDTLKEWGYDYVPSATQSTTGQAAVPSDLSQESRAHLEKPWKGKSIVGKKWIQNRSKSSKRTFTDLNESNLLEELGIKECTVAVEKTPEKAMCRLKKFGHPYQLRKRLASGEVSKHNGAKQSTKEKEQDIPKMTANNVSDELASFHLESEESRVVSPQQESTQDTYSQLLTEMGRPGNDTNLMSNPNSESTLRDIRHQAERQTQYQPRQSTQSMSQVNPIQLNLSPIPKDTYYYQNSSVLLGGCGDILEEARLASIGESLGKRADQNEFRRLERMWGGDSTQQAAGHEKTPHKMPQKSSVISGHQKDIVLPSKGHVNFKSSQKSDESLFSSPEEKLNSPTEVIEISVARHSPDIQATGSFPGAQKFNSEPSCQTVITISSDSTEGGLTQEQSTRLPHSSSSPSQESWKSRGTVTNSSDENRMPNTPDYLLMQGGQALSQASSVGDKLEEETLLCSVKDFLEAKYSSQCEKRTMQVVPEELLAKVRHYWASVQT